MSTGSCQTNAAPPNRASPHKTSLCKASVPESSPLTATCNGDRSTSVVPASAEISEGKRFMWTSFGRVSRVALIVSVPSKSMDKTTRYTPIAEKVYNSMEDGWPAVSVLVTRGRAGGEAARRTVSVRRSPHVGNTLFWGGVYTCSKLHVTLFTTCNLTRIGYYLRIGSGLSIARAPILRTSRSAMSWLFIFCTMLGRR